MLCKDGAVRLTYSSGREWADVGQVDRGLAMTVSPDNSRVYAVRPGSSDCAGVEVVRVSSKNTVLSCARTDVSPGAIKASLSMTSDSTWLAIGDQMLRSTDLKTWKQP